MVFGKLRVVESAGTDFHQQALWLCSCSCGKNTVVPSASLLSKNTRSCGCLHADTMKKRVGKSHPMWNPKLSQEERDKQRLGTPTKKKLYLISQLVRTRDRATCLACGDRGTHVHHLEPWAFDRNLRYDPANLVTLCKECHTQFHELYGGDAGLEDFEEYLKP
jgi:5-methylcytosine-specific restriction endonuclease McrA